jgi:hypothetical protein
MDRWQYPIYSTCFFGRLSTFFIDTMPVVRPVSFCGVPHNGPLTGHLVSVVWSSVPVFSGLLSLSFGPLVRYFVVYGPKHTRLLVLT